MTWHMRADATETLCSRGTPSLRDGVPSRAGALGGVCALRQSSAFQARRVFDPRPILSNDRAQALVETALVLPLLLLLIVGLFDVGRAVWLSN
ncbi:MAG TPA: TadE/TadG family type IV pilus assembly protein, partial [Candidatus Limnocylindria bacterium]|nr:TadE/TadG family type IV pilus assembly protein [Candidatus Limnocylindria bacterium]